MGQIVLLKDVRLRHSDIFTAREYEPGDGKPRYSATVVVELGSENHKKIMAAIQAEMKEKFKDKAKTKYEALKNDSKAFCYVKGEIKDDDDEALAGKMVLAAHRQGSKGAPAVVDRNPKKTLVAADGKPYNGCYVNLKMDIYAQTDRNVGVRCGLLGIQFSKDGDAFSGGPANADGFDDISDGTDGDDDFGDETESKSEKKKSNDDFGDDDDF